MKRMNPLNDVWMEELADLLNAENQLSEVLPKMGEASQSLTLKLALEAQLEVTKEHINRLQDIFSDIGQNPHRVTCKTMKGLIQESEGVLNSTENSQDRDIAIINIAQRVKHYEIEGYKKAHEHAVELGHTRTVRLLDKTINEERAINLHLSELAQGMINNQAIEPKSSESGFYIPEGKFGRGGIKKRNKTTDISRFISEGNPNNQEDSGKDKE